MIDYDPHRWGSHLFDIKGSMLREITGRVGATVLWAVAVVLADAAFGNVMEVPFIAHQFVGIALGLLLVFRTNASYDRFWEGRKKWGSIVNESRNLARTAIVHLRGDRVLMEEVVRWGAMFPYATMHYLRGEPARLGPAADRLPADEVRDVLSARHVPLAVALRISERLRCAADAGLISDYVQMRIDQNVQLLIDYLGACERIRKTPLPYAYMVHIRRALILFCLTLPFALIEAYGHPATVLFVLLVSYIFYGIEEIGVEIENPFDHDANDLPLERICETIEADLMALIEDDHPGGEVVPTPEEAKADGRLAASA